MTGDFDDLEIEIITSRRALIDVITGLADQREALTVLGGHAVVEVTQGILALPPDDTTRDGDLGVTPKLPSDAPNLSARMTELGFEAARPERPGVWSPISQRDRDIHDRDSVDLIAPMSLARGDLTTNRSIRAARIGAHGKHAVSATHGTELSILDRQWRTLRSFDGGPTVDAYVAGASALLCAKAYKIHDRLDPTELRRNADRLRPKDFADLYRLLLVITPEDAAGVFAQGTADPKISDAVALGNDYLIEILTDASTVASMVADAWGDTSREAEFHAHVDNWRRRFAA
ncbi:hypothetical protein [Microbacterium saperdae]|uniref:Nucleotidyltransferase AbiEii toxin of type IV toxin-antitoxin system n=1 Tax=Microbacterium saperdae TaxID=69368 RepID=A0A543BL76_9MICO|nr:hypothetical protein [Microbacterium saperdae]TQL85579.1 hypothetical protein FB560_1201 [Microbacterium saperdae]GGM62642.1 hypothetical protein GCM10010489_37640 [Microbacterium saperdae]